MARKKADDANAQNRKNGGADDEAPPAGAESITAEGSHRSISNGDGTARQVPIVNASGEYPPRPGDSDKRESERAGR